MIKPLLILLVLAPPLQVRTSPAWWWDSLNFRDVPTGLYESLTLWHEGVEVTFTGTGTGKEPNQVRVIAVNWKLHTFEDFGGRAVSGGAELWVYFYPPVRGVEFRVGADDCGMEQPGLYCYDEAGVYISGDCGEVFGCTRFGPAALCPERRPYQWLFGSSRTWNGVTQQVASCVLVSEERDVFVASVVF